MNKIDITLNPFTGEKWDLGITQESMDNFLKNVDARIEENKEKENLHNINLLKLHQTKRWSEIFYDIYDECKELMHELGYIFVSERDVNCYMFRGDFRFPINRNDEEFEDFSKVYVVKIDKETKQHCSSCGCNFIEHTVIVSEGMWIDEFYGGIYVPKKMKTGEIKILGTDNEEV